MIKQLRSRVHRRTSTCSSCYSLRVSTQHRIRTKKVNITCIAARITAVFLNRQRKWQMERFAIRGIEEQKHLERLSTSRVECPHPVCFPATEHLWAASANGAARCSTCELKGREVRSFDLFKCPLTDSSCATRRPCGQAHWVEIGTSTSRGTLYKGWHSLEEPAVAGL